MESDGEGGKEGSDVEGKGGRLSFMGAHCQLCVLTICWCGVTTSVGAHHSSMEGLLPSMGGGVVAILFVGGWVMLWKGVMEGGGRGRG